MLNSIVELPEFIKRADSILTEEEKTELLYFLAKNPLAGSVIPCTGGLRKLRWGSSNKGKRSGSRVIYFFYNQTMPLFLITIFRKNEKIDLSKAEQKILTKMVNELIENYKIK